LEPKALGLTYWFDVPLEGEARTVTVRFSGRRTGVQGKSGRRDAFTVVERVDPVLAGSGPIAITVRVSDLTPGVWRVSANAVSEARPGTATRRAVHSSPRRLPRASSSGTTAYAPVVRVRAPGANLVAWPVLVSVGVVVALTTQALLAAHTHLPEARVLAVSLLASVAGLVGAKVYYLVERRDRGHNLLTEGMCVQGFVLGAIGALVVGALVSNLPVGPLLDVTAPGLLLAMTIGRVGCFFGGCCAGRPTASRWGLWSSDRSLGMRRIPTQLLESGLAMFIGLAALVTVWTTTPRRSGAVFIAAMAAYTLGRQLLFPLRDIPRNTTHGRTLTIMLAGLVVVVDLAVVTFS